MYDKLLSLGDPGDLPGEARYVGLALLVGLLGGFVGSIFHLSLDVLQTWPALLGEYLSGWRLVATASMVTMCCTVLAAFLVRRFAPEAGGSGVQEVEGAMEGLRQVRWRRVLPVKFFGGLLAISSGLVLGREGPTIHIGASVAEGVAETFHTNELERRGLLASGAAAGLACAFNAPLSAVLFVIEETHKQFPYTFRTYIGIGIAVVGATLMTEALTGRGPDLRVLVALVPLLWLPAFALLGAALGVLGMILNAGILRALDFGTRNHRTFPYVYPAVVGLIGGAIFILLPDAATGGENVILGLVADSPGLLGLLLLAAVRFVTMIGSYSSGVPGGIFAPILALATCVGLAFGEALVVVFPDAGFNPEAFALAAMGGLFAASVRAPIVGVALTLELTGSYGLALPLMLTCLVADLTAQWCGGRPIYTQLLERTLKRAGIKATQDRNPGTGLA
jgi:CIC family chloride channel protein